MHAHCFSNQKRICLIFYYLFHFWLCWVFTALHGLSLVSESGGLLAIVVRWLNAVASLVVEHRLWEARTSVVAACGLSSCGARA